MARLVAPIGGTLTGPFGARVHVIGPPRGPNAMGSIVQRSALGGGTGDRSAMRNPMNPSPRPAAVFPEGSRNTSVGFTVANTHAGPKFRIMPSGAIFLRGQLGQPDTFR